MTRPGLIPASYVYLLRDGSVLLQRRANTGYMDGYWAAGAAGHIEQRETAVAAAVREVREELGVAISAKDLVPSSVMQRTDGSDSPLEQRVDWFFSCSIWRGEPTIVEPQKCAELRWFPLDGLPTQVPDYERVALDWLRDGDGVALLDVGFPAPL
ncbi:MAG: NUDIX domain-containing protein [Arachnia sp.]